MSFLFKSKKQAGPSIPPAARNIHSSDGAPAAAAMTNGFQEKTNERNTSTPVGSVNNSINSLDAPVRSDPSWNRRERADSDAPVCSTSVLRTDRSGLTNFFLSRRAATMESAKSLMQVSTLGRSGA
jgi:hypothetical protein